MKTKHFFPLLALMLAVFIGCKKDFEKHLPKTEQNSSGWGTISSFNGESSCLDEMEGFLISNDQRQLATFIYDGLLQHESTLAEYGTPVFEATLTEPFEEGGNSFFNVIPLIEDGADSVKSLLFLGTENGFFHYVFYPKSKALDNSTFSADFEYEGGTFTLHNEDFLLLFQLCDCYLFCPEGEIQQRGPICPWNPLFELFKNIKRGFAHFIATHGFNLGGSGDPGDYTTTIWVGGGGGGGSNSSGSGYSGGSGGTPIWEFYNSQILQNYLLSCETAIAAQTGAGDGGNPGDPNDPTNSPGFLAECQQFFAIRECLTTSAPQEAFLYYNPGIREELGEHFLLNGCTTPGTCGDTPEGNTWEYDWLEYRRLGVNNHDAINLRQYQLRYMQVCSKTAGFGLDQQDKIRLLHELRRFEIENFGDVSPIVFGELVQTAIEGDCFDFLLSNSCLCERYVDSKLNSLVFPQDPSAYEQLIEYIKGVRDVCENRCYDYWLHADFLNNWLYAIQQNGSNVTTDEVYNIGLWAKSVKDQIIARNLMAFGEHILVALDLAAWEMDILVTYRYFNAIPNSARNWGMSRMITKLDDPISSFSTFKYAEKFGINSYDDLVKVFNDLKWSRSQIGVQFHHLVEQRFANKVGSWIGSNTGTWDSIVLEIAEHQSFTTAWRQKIPYIGDTPGPNGLNTATATLDDIKQAALEIYQDFPEILQALGL